MNHLILILVRQNKARPTMYMYTYVYDTDFPVDNLIIELHEIFPWSLTQYEIMLYADDIFIWD